MESEGNANLGYNPQDSPVPGYQQQPPPGQGYQQPPPGQNYGQPPPGYGTGVPPAGAYYGAVGQPMGMQPMPTEWMNKPEGFEGCPPGLEYLTKIDQIIVKQQIDIIEMLTQWEQANKYRLLNSVGQQVFFAAEESNLAMRQWTSADRGFVIHITDNSGQEVIRVTRDFKCCAGNCWCASSDRCAYVVKVEAPVGTTVGFVRQECSFWNPHYSIFRESMEDKIGIIRGPGSPCCSDVEFKIMNAPDEDTEIGKITKQYSGMQEMVTDADTFSVSFPMDMDVRAKASFIGAVFLIDFMYFESSPRKDSDRRRHHHH